MALIFLLAGATGWTQELGGRTPSSPEASLADTVHQLQLQMQELQTVVKELKTESDLYRTETLALRRELQLNREKFGPSGQASAHPAEASSEKQEARNALSESSPAATGAGPDEQRITKLEDDQQLLTGKVEEQYQTKVESASKYRVKLSGMILMNVFSNQGNVDMLEIPGAALANTPSATGGNTGGSFSASLRQSQIALETYGPTIAGAKTRANIVADFFGEGSDTLNGTVLSDLHLRTGTIRMDWPRTSLIVGQDDLFFSPVYPTSYASVAFPALSYAGNLWGYFPQARVEHRLLASDNSTVTVSAGIFDPLTGETPSDEFLRLPLAGESARQPGYGARVEWSHRFFGQPLTVGAGGYYNREKWGVSPAINGWAGTTDWIVPLGRRFSLSGKFFHGEAIGGLGGGIGRSVLFNGPLTSPATTVQALPSVGGWSQFKFQPFTKLEFNVAAGEDDVVARDVRGFTQAPGYFAANLTRNRSEFGNIIYRPRSDLLFSAEFRTLRTFLVDGGSQSANQVNFMMGVFF